MHSSLITVRIMWDIVFFVVVTLMSNATNFYGLYLLLFTSFEHVRHIYIMSDFPALISLWSFFLQPITQSSLTTVRIMWDIVFFVVVSLMSNAATCHVLCLLLFASFEHVRHIFIISDFPALISLWSFVLVQLYFYLCLYLKLKPDEKNNWLHQIKNTIFHSLIIPLNVMTCGGFWILFHYDRNYILPPILDPLISRWANHVVHTMPPFAILAQMYWSHDNISCKTCYQVPTKRTSLTILNVALILYIIMLLRIYFAEGRWVYFGMQYLSPLQNTAVIAAAYLVCIVSHNLGYDLHCTFAKHRHANMDSLETKNK